MGIYFTVVNQHSCSGIEEYVLRVRSKLSFFQTLNNFIVPYGESSLINCVKNRKSGWETLGLQSHCKTSTN
jgi:hypothetical protein